MARDLLKVCDELTHLGVSRFVVGRAQNRRRVDSRGNQRRQRRFHQLAALSRDAEIARDERLRSRCAEAYDDLRADTGYLCFQPRAAGGDFFGIRFFVNPEFPARGRIEVLDDVRDIDVRAVYSRLCESHIEQFPGWSDKGVAFEIFAIAGLLAHQHYFGAGVALAENRLRGALPDVAAAALLHGFAKVIERRVRLDQVERRRQDFPFSRHAVSKLTISAHASFRCSWTRGRTCFP